jgi:serine/threonine protein kinase
LEGINESANRRKIPKKMNVVEKIGIGGTSEVYKVKDNKTSFAFKTLKNIYQYHSTACIRLKNEYEIHRELTHENIVQCYDWIKINGRSGILMEYIDGITLENLTVDSNWEGFATIHKVISYLQSLRNPIVHNDLSTRNIMISKLNQVKVIDFSSAYYLNYNVRIDNNLSQLSKGLPPLGIDPEALNKLSHSQ